MNLTLSRDLVGLDTETTGTIVGYDHIVQISLVRVAPDFTRTRWTTLVKPPIPIPHEATYGDGGTYPGHGITNEMVATAPPWADVGPFVVASLQDADLAGYNVRFDLDMIDFECSRERIPLPPWGRIVDVRRLWQILEPRTLSDAVERFAGRTLDGAHGAEADVEGTLDALVGQLATGRLPATVDALHALQWPWPKDAVDPDGKIVRRDGVLRWTFGKYAGMELIQTPKDYFKWIVSKDFSDEVKGVARQALTGALWVKT